MANRHRAAGLFLTLSLLAGSTAPLAASATTVNDTANSFLNYSMEQIQALITKLQSRLEELKKNSSPCFVSDSGLSLGDGEGNEAVGVRRLQDFLREKGYFKLKSTGYYGKITRAAIIAFQKENGLAQTGEFDAATKAKAHSLSCTTLAKIVKQEVKKEIKEEKKMAQNSGAVTSIAMSVNGPSIAWTANGYSKNGFKIVWSKNAGPTYPTREGDKYIYLNDPAAKSATLHAFGGSGNYHVRVCEYLGGACGAYSNEATVQL
jgi:peptidoglycan hydrolase-like protein with peptidoglycan-binding domain